VDFLAQPPALPFDPEGAADKLAAIAEDSAFKPIFCALRTFTATENRQLIVNLGNHDLELALPWVREALTTILSGGDRAARGRITLAFDGSGVLVSVGQARVLCVHGNEVDAWNVTDHEQVRRIGRDFLHGRGVEPWIPNGGSQLVSDVMNPLKREYPFIDLLKPEMPAVFPTLVALRPSVVTQLAKLTPAVVRRTWDNVRMATGFLESSLVQIGTSEYASDALGGGRLHALLQQREKMARDLLDRTEARWRENTVPLELLEADLRAEYLGVINALGKLFAGKGSIEALRTALDGLDQDRSFDPGAEDDTYRELDKMVGGDIDFLVAGHTHLERALKRRRGRGCYFNSGTWARLIQIPPQLRQNAADFAALFGRMKAGTMDALDGGVAGPALTLRRCSVVSIWHEAGTAFGELRRIVAQAGAVTPFAAQPVPNTRLTAE